MITDSEILDTIPQEGAERALQVFNIMKPAKDAPNALGKNIVAMGRAILAYAEWVASQEHTTQMLIAQATNGKVSKIIDGRNRFRSQLQNAVK